MDNQRFNPANDEVIVDEKGVKTQLNTSKVFYLAANNCPLSSSVVCSYSGGSDELSDDITQQQLLPGVKYVNTHPPISSKMPADVPLTFMMISVFCHQRSQSVDGQVQGV